MDEFRRIVTPVLNTFASKTFKTTFVQQVAVPKYIRPVSAAYVEAFCRTFMSVAPFFESSEAPDICELMLAAWKSVIDGSYLTSDEWKCGDQLLVEAANLVYGFLLYPKSWSALPTLTQNKIFDILLTASAITPHKNNWYLFKCAVDIFLHKHGKLGSIRHVFQLLNEFEAWYVGDGWYKDGPAFKMNYYNSYVILPFSYIIYNYLRRIQSQLQTRFEVVCKRIQRHAEWLERLISIDGTFPIFGRSVVYRTAVFHALVFCAVHVGLPPSLSHGQIRRGLGLVHTKMWSSGYTQFDPNGFLHLGFIGSQPWVADSYSNNGSCYFTVLSFSVYSLPSTHPFWTADEKPITQERAWTNVGSAELKKDVNLNI